MPERIVQQSSEPDAEAVGLGDVVSFVRTQWVVLAAWAVAGAVLAAAAGFLMTPIYRATVVVTPVGADEMRGALTRMAGSLGGLASLAGISLSGGSGEKDEALAILKSRVFAETLITNEKMLPAFFPKRWDASAQKWKVKDPMDVPTMSDGFEYFDKKLRTVIEDRDRGLITVRVDWRDRELAAKWANLMIRMVNDQLRVRKLSELDKNLMYLNRELEKTNVIELRDSLYKLIEAQTNERMLASVREEYAFRIVDPATVPDIDRYESPKKALMAALGAMCGLLLAVIYISVRKRALGS